MLLALATLVVAGLSSANNAGQARGRQHRLRGQLGLPAPGAEEKLPVLWKRLRWILANRDPVALDVVLSLLPRQISAGLEGDQWKDDAVLGRVIDWMTAQVQRRLAAGQMPWPDDTIASMHARMSEVETGLDWAVDFYWDGETPIREHLGQGLDRADATGINPFGSFDAMMDGLEEEMSVALWRIQNSGLSSDGPDFDPFKQATERTTTTWGPHGTRVHLHQSSMGWDVDMVQEPSSSGPRPAAVFGPQVDRLPGLDLDFYGYRFSWAVVPREDPTGQLPLPVTLASSEIFMDWPYRHVRTAEDVWMMLEDLEEFYGMDSEEYAFGVKVGIDALILRVRHWQLRTSAEVISDHFLHLLDMARAGAFPALGTMTMDQVFRQVLDDEIENIIEGVEAERGIGSADDALADSEEHLVVAFSDGAQLIEITGQEAIKREGLKMVHCIGKRKNGHPQMLEQGETRVFSYRDTTGKPRGTLEVFNKGADTLAMKYPVSQIQGPHNGPITDPDGRKRLLTLSLLLRDWHKPPEVSSLMPRASMDPERIEGLLLDSEHQRYQIFKYNRAPRSLEYQDLAFISAARLEEYPFDLVKSVIDEAPAESWNLTGDP
jgi:hypothetical protein